MGKTLGLRPANVNHLIYKVSPTLRQGKWLPDAPGTGQRPDGREWGVMPPIGVFRMDSWRNNFYKQKLTLLFKHGRRCRRFKQKN